jgi:hypothetical protein
MFNSRSRPAEAIHGKPENPRWMWRGLCGAALAALLLVPATCHDGKTDSASVSTIHSDLWSARWENLGGQSNLDGPAIASWATGRLDAFWRSTTGRLQHRWFPNFGTWSQLEDLGAIAGPPAAVSTADSELDVFSFNGSTSLVNLSFTIAAGWVTKPTISIPFSHRAAASSQATVASWEPGRLDVFWRGADNHLKHIWRSSYGASWTAVEDLGETLNSSPAAVSSDTLKIDVFWQASNGELRHKWFPSCAGCNTWSTSVARTSANVVFTSPTVASWEPGRLDIFWGSPSQLLHTWRFTDGTWWSGGVQNLGGQHTATPAAVSWGPNRIDVIRANSFGNDIEHMVWQITSPSDPLFAERPRAPTVVASNDQISTGENWEFSVAAAPPGTAGCSNGAYVTSGTNRTTGKLLLRVSPSTSTAAGTDLTSQLNYGVDASIPNDNVMVRAKNGDLALVRHLGLDQSCMRTEGSGTTCPPVDPPNFAADCGTRPGGRFAIGVWRSSDCGANWALDDTKNLIDPLLPAYGNGTYGGGGAKCWAGWDREEAYYDYWSDRLFLTFTGNPVDPGVGGNTFKVLRSDAGVDGNGPFTMYTLDDFSVPGTMTSLPGMLFFFTCSGVPKLRFIDPNSNWPTGNITSAVKAASLPGETCQENSVWGGLTGSESVTRVATYVDDSGSQWWVVRIAFPVSDHLRVLTVQVKADGTTQILASKDIFAGTPPFGEAHKHAVQMTAVEPYPIFDSSGNWTGENTTLYYWREEFWNFAPNVKLHNLTRAMAVRDIANWGDPIQIGTILNCAVVGCQGKPGDYVKGAFWYDTGAPESPLRYLILRSDIPNTNGKLRSTILSLPRGLADN